MVERNHVLILNWLFDVAARRTPITGTFHTQLAQALASGDPRQGCGRDAAACAVRLVEVSGHVSELEASEWREPRRKR